MADQAPRPITNLNQLGKCNGSLKQGPTYLRGQHKILCPAAHDKNSSQTTKLLSPDAQYEFPPIGSRPLTTSLRSRKFFWPSPLKLYRDERAGPSPSDRQIKPIGAVRSAWPPEPTIYSHIAAAGQNSSSPSPTHPASLGFSPAAAARWCSA